MIPVSMLSLKHSLVLTIFWFSGTRRLVFQFSWEAGLLPSSCPTHLPSEHLGVELWLDPSDSSEVSAISQQETSELLALRMLS